jgi:hypothetical protein
VDAKRICPASAGRISLYFRATSRCARACLRAEFEYRLSVPFSPTTLSDDPRDGSSNKSVDKPLDPFYVNIPEAPKEGKRCRRKIERTDVPLRNPPREFLFALGFIKARDSILATLRPLIGRIERP